MNIRSIHFRLAALYSALVVLVLLVFGAYTYQSMQSRLTSEMVETLTRRAEQIGDHFLSSNAAKPTIGRQIQAVYSPEAASRFIRITKPDGKIFYVSGQPKDDLFNPAHVPLPKKEPEHVVTRKEPLKSGFSLLIVAVPQQVGDERWIIEMGTPTDQIDTALHELLISLLVSFPLLILTATLGSYFLVKKALKPVEDIRATAEKITFGNLSNRLPVATTGDALEHLSTTLNQMLERLEDAYQQASRFSADASHELRTPITIMRTELESIVQDQALTDEIRAQVGSVLEEAEYLSHITESLFAISRMDAGEARMESKPFDLAHIVRSTAEQMMLLAEDKKIDVAIDVSQAWIEGDQPRMKQLVVNLLDNAIKYTPGGGKIYVRVITASNKAVLIIDDNGIGISKEAVPHVFERFYRADKSHFRNIGGAGIGLAIARSIVLAHGGIIEIKSEEGSGTCVTVELPLRSDSRKHYEN